LSPLLLITDSGLAVFFLQKESARYLGNDVISDRQIRVPFH
jgi:hypothetical protein